MPIRLRCPEGHRFSVSEEDAGRRVRCPDCDLAVRVPDPSEEEERPRRRKRPRVADGPDTSQHPYHRVRIGLALHYAWILVNLLSLAMFILTMIASADPRSDFARLMGMLLVLTMVGLFVARPILGILGSVFCLRVPSGSEARPWALTTLILDGCSLGFGLLAFVLGAAAGGLRRNPDAAATGGILLLLCVLANYVCNLLTWVFLQVFLKKFSEYVKEWGSASEAIPLLVQGVLLLVAPLVFVFGLPLIALAVGREGIVVILFVGYGLFLAWLVACAKVFLNALGVLARLRDHLRKEIEKLG